MRATIDDFRNRYQLALREHLRVGGKAHLHAARRLGSEALAAGIHMLDLVKLHDQTVVGEVLPGGGAAGRSALIKRAGIFFAAAVTPIEKTHQSTREATAHLEKIIETLSQRTAQLAASNGELSLEVAKRKVVEATLKDSKQHYSDLLEKSDRLKDELRHLSRQILSAQEEERKAISRDLHDVIGQTLTQINIRLSSLAKDASKNAKGLDRNIARTQVLVVKSVEIVHQFARELRPAVLDDLGLIPALHTFLKGFSQRTGVRTHMTAIAGVEKLSSNRRAVLFRVAQEALTNVARHAHAHRVDVTIENHPNGIIMRVKDDGKSFKVEGVLNSRSNKRLGILGMRERLEMVGGRLMIESTAGIGTTISALVPRPKILARKTRPMSSKAEPPKPN